MPTVDLPQGHVRYRAAGPPDSPLPPVVFVHGLLVNGELWTGVADRLAVAGIRSFAPDLPLGAHTIAVRPDADLHPRGVARLILDFLDAFDLRDVTLVGNDTGGALCQFVLDTDASRVGRLVLTNCDAFDKFPPAPFGLLVKFGARPGRLRTLAGPMRWKWLRHSVIGFGGLARDQLDPELTLRWATPISDKDIRGDAARFMREIRKTDLVDVSTRLCEFGRPVLLPWGTADPFFRIDLAHRLAEVFPDARVVPVEGAKTFVALDEPDRLAAEIVAFAQAPAR